MKHLLAILVLVVALPMFVVLSLYALVRVAYIILWEDTEDPEPICRDRGWHGEK